MVDFIVEQYHFIKFFHILAVILWVTGMITIPLLKMHKADSAIVAINKYYLRPGMICAVLLGLSMLYVIGFSTGLWIHIKLLLVVFLLISHGLMMHMLKKKECCMRLILATNLILTFAILFTVLIA